MQLLRVVDSVVGSNGIPRLTTVPLSLSDCTSYGALLILYHVEPTRLLYQDSVWYSTVKIDV